jgi:caffeoyl-CoA O-methyltransferase
MADPESRAGRGYWTPEIDAYLRGLYAQEDPGMRYALRAIEEAGMPPIQVSPTDGRILEVLLRMTDARRVVEIGTLAGYSAQWIARALPATGRLWTIELDPRHVAVARGVLARAGLADKVCVLEGSADVVLPTIEAEGPFDAVFVDADKVGYERYARWATRHLRPGGLLVGDNAYLFGRLAGVEPDSPEQAAELASMRAFHELLAREFYAVCLPTPDGLAVGMKRVSPAGST